MLISKILFFLSLNCTYCLTFYVLRSSIKSFFFKGNDIPFLKSLIITISLYVIADLMTFFVEDVVKIMGILGGLCAVIVCYVSPILCYVTSNGLPKAHYKNLFSFFILGVICVLGAMSTTKTVIDNIKGGE
jgi:hypothetical protein